MNGLPIQIRPSWCFLIFQLKPAMLSLESPRDGFGELVLSMKPEALGGFIFYIIILNAAPPSNFPTTTTPTQR